MLEQEKTRENLLEELAELRREVARLEEEKNDLEILLETTTEHSTEIESELEERNQEIQSYLKVIKRELEIGRQIQTDFLPENLPELSGWELDVRFEPAREV